MARTVTRAAEADDGEASTVCTQPVAAPGPSRNIKRSPQLCRICPLELRK